MAVSNRITLANMAWLRQRDGVTCGPSVAVMAGALIDADYGEPLRQQRAQQWFDAEQGRVHRSVNMVWPRALGTTPAGMARALNDHATARGVRYRWRRVTRRDALADVCAALARGWPVAMLIGSALPRHWVLLTEFDGQALRCYEPGSGRLMTVPLGDIRQSRLSPLGFPRPFAFVLPALPRPA